MGLFFMLINYQQIFHTCENYNNGLPDIVLIIHSVTMKDVNKSDQILK